LIIDLLNPEIPDVLQVRVTPKASANRIKVEHQTDGTRLIRVYVTVAAEDGKANKAVIDLLSKELGLPKSSFKIIRGLTSRDKTVAIEK